MTSGQFTKILEGFRAGESGSEGMLIELVYKDLRRMASRHLAGPRFSTLNTTSLINESYLRLVSPAARHVQSKDHFLYLASRVMRQIVIDNARSRIKAAEIVDKGADVADAMQRADALNDAHTLIRIDEALDDLAKENERQARVVECRFFSGMTEDETARALGASLRTVQRDWDRAREWLRLHLEA